MVTEHTREIFTHLPSSEVAVRAHLSLCSYMILIHEMQQSRTEISVGSFHHGAGGVCVREPF